MTMRYTNLLFIIIIIITRATHTFMHECNEPSSCCYCPVAVIAEHYPTSARILVLRFAKGRKLSWPGWLVTYRGSMPTRTRSPIPVLTGLDVE